MIIITTSHRKVETIQRTVDSLMDAGWNARDIVVSCDGNYYPKLPSNIWIIIQEKKLGAWAHWFAALSFLLKNSKDEWLPIIQDDVIFAKNLKKYMRICEIPADASIVSPFTPAHYDSETKGWNKISDPSLWMAQTYFIRREAAQHLLESKIVWRIRGNRQIDNRVGLWLLQSKKSIYYHSPSLAEHIGEESTLWPTARVAGKRKSASFSADYDCLSLLN